MSHNFCVYCLSCIAHIALLMQILPYPITAAGYKTGYIHTMKHIDRIKTTEYDHNDTVENNLIIANNGTNVKLILLA